MKSQKPVHSLPRDVKEAIQSHKTVESLWKSLTPLAKNEFICWVISAKLPETRARRLKRLQEELLEGKRRPCCWAGCPHR